MGLSSPFAVFLGSGTNSKKNSVKKLRNHGEKNFLLLLSVFLASPSLSLPRFYHFLFANKFPVSKTPKMHTTL